jgi:hypothetical protein
MKNADVRITSAESPPNTRFWNELAYAKVELRLRCISVKEKSDAGFPASLSLRHK